MKFANKQDFFIESINYGATGLPETLQETNQEQIGCRVAQYVKSQREG